MSCIFNSFLKGLYLIALYFGTNTTEDNSLCVYQLTLSVLNCADMDCKPWNILITLRHSRQTWVKQYLEMFVLACLGYQMCLQNRKIPPFPACFDNHWKAAWCSKTHAVLLRLTLNTCKYYWPTGIHRYVTFDQNMHSTLICKMNDGD